MNKLNKAFSAKDVFSMAFGTMVGWLWIMLSGVWADASGILGALIAFAVGAIMCIFVGMAYAELTPALPFAGGSVVYAFKSMGYWPAVFTGLAASFSYLGVIALEGPSFIAAFEYLIPIPKMGYLWTISGFKIYFSWSMVGVALSAVLVYVNIKGASVTAVFQKLANIAKIGVGIIFIIGVLFNGESENVGPLFTSSGGFFTTLIMVPAMFVGFEIIPHSAEEMNMPLKKIPKLLIISICATAAWYMLMIIATCIAAPEGIRTMGKLPVADAMGFVFGNRIFRQMCILGALCGIVSCWNGFIYSAARCLYSMAEARMIPAFLGKLHPKYKTPYVAVLFCGFISAAACFLGQEAIEWFVNASSFGVILLYLMTVLALIMLRVKQPDISRPYKIKHFKTISVLALISVLFFAFVYMPFGPSSLSPVEWGMTLVWHIGGLLFALWCTNHYKDITMEEREKALTSS